MKILIVSFPESLEMIGGEDQIAVSLKNEFEKSGCTADICTRNNYDEENGYHGYDLILSLNVPVQINSKKDIVWAVWIFNTNIGSKIEDILKHDFDIYFTNSDFIYNKIKENSFAIKLDIPPSDKYLRTKELLFPSSKNTDILYLGNYNPEYKTVNKIGDYLIPCIDSRYNFEIYGSKWKIDDQKKLSDQGVFRPEFFTHIYEDFAKGVFPLEKCNEISDYSKIFINFHSPDQAGFQMINNRMYDLLLNGCFIITDDFPYQREKFGDIVEYSSGSNDLRNKIDYYLSDPEKIYEKQLGALKYGNDIYNHNNYHIVSLKIIDMFNEYKQKASETRLSLKNKRFVFAVIVNNLPLLDKFIESVNNDNCNFIFFVHKNNRIKSTKIIQNRNVKKYDIVTIDEDPFIFEIPMNYFKVDDIVIPSYSNIIYSKDFVENIASFFEEKTNYLVCKYYVSDVNHLRDKIYGSSYENNEENHYMYGTYILNIIDESILANDVLLWSNISGLRSCYLDIVCPEIVFDTDENRKKFVSDKKIIPKIIENKEKRIEIHDDKEIKNLRFSVIHNNSKIEDIQYENIEIIDIHGHNIEEKIRELQSHYTIFTEDLKVRDWQRLVRIIASHLNYKVFLFGKSIIIKTSELFQLKPCNTVSEYIDFIKSCNLCAIDINDITYDISIVRSDVIRFPNSNGLNIAVLSMCGVSSFEDKYGLGGEHQVIHWLSSSFERRSDVYKCHIFDTYNCNLINPDEYDVIFSNSCWRSVSAGRKRKDNLSIFWHFNMNPGNVMETIEHMNYDMVWTNSPKAYQWFLDHKIPSMIKHLNASSQYHYPYPWKSSLFLNENSMRSCIYLGGYQPFYKGKSLIDKFIKPCMNKDFDFAIYGNRLWKSDIQKKALQTDPTFKIEYYDESYDPYYKGIVAMPDFNILAKNAKIWINMNAQTQSEGWKMINDRPIWLAACGGFCITDDTEESRTFFNSEGSDLCPVAFSTGDDDLVDKIRYYLSHDQERTEIASRGPEFVKRKRLFSDDTADLVIESFKNARI